MDQIQEKYQKKTRGTKRENSTEDNYRRMLLVEFFNRRDKSEYANTMKIRDFKYSQRKKN